MTADLSKIKLRIQGLRILGAHGIRLTTHLQNINNMLESQNIFWPKVRFVFSLKPETLTQSVSTSEMSDVIEDLLII